MQVGASAVKFAILWKTESASVFFLCDKLSYPFGGLPQAFHDLMIILASYQKSLVRLLCFDTVIESCPGENYGKFRLNQVGEKLRDRFTDKNPRNKYLEENNFFFARI